MKIKKIIKGIIGIGAVGGIAYAAFKLGESNGEAKGAGSISISFKDDDDLARLMQLFDRLKK